jgi:hypothetical protein
MSAFFATRVLFIQGDIGWLLTVTPGTAPEGTIDTTLGAHRDGWPVRNLLKFALTPEALERTRRSSQFSRSRKKAARPADALFSWDLDHRLTTGSSLSLLPDTVGL